MRDEGRERERERKRELTTSESEKEIAKAKNAICKCDFGGLGWEVTKTLPPTGIHDFAWLS